MNAAFTYACAVVWNRSGEKDAGWELIKALNSPEMNIRSIASSALVEAGPQSLCLLEAALAMKEITPEQAAPCLLDILANLPEEVLSAAN